MPATSAGSMPSPLLRNAPAGDLGQEPLEPFVEQYAAEQPLVGHAAFGVGVDGGDLLAQRPAAVVCERRGRPSRPSLGGALNCVSPPCGGDIVVSARTFPELGLPAVRLCRASGDVERL